MLASPRQDTRARPRQSKTEADAKLRGRGEGKARRSLDYIADNYFVKLCNFLMNLCITVHKSSYISETPGFPADLKIFIWLFDN